MRTEINLRSARRSLLLLDDGTPMVRLIDVVDRLHSAGMFLLGNVRWWEPGGYGYHFVTMTTDTQTHVSLDSLRCAMGLVFDGTIDWFRFRKDGVTEVWALSHEQDAVLLRIALGMTRC